MQIQGKKKHNRRVLVNFAKFWIGIWINKVWFDNDYKIVKRQFGTRSSRQCKVPRKNWNTLVILYATLPYIAKSNIRELQDCWCHQLWIYWCHDLASVMWKHMIYNNHHLYSMQTEDTSIFNLRGGIKGRKLFLIYLPYSLQFPYSIWCGSFLIQHW